MVFAAMLAFAMLLQSIIFTFLGVRASIREEVVWTKRFTERISESITIVEVNLHDMKISAIASGEIVEKNRESFSCIVIELGEKDVSKSSQCKFQGEMTKLSQQVRSKKSSVLGFAGHNVNYFLFGSEVMIIAVPLLNEDGHVYGSVAVERSLLPVYARYQNDLGIALCYLFINVILFSAIGFFRFKNIIFRPLDKLLLIADNSYQDEQTLFPISDAESAFRKLSIKLNALFDRVKRDNSSLRKTILELEESNRELKEKKDLVVRSEKLAAAGRLSAGLAHEIGNPLSIIQGYIELLGRDDLAADEKKQFSQNAQQELDRIKKLIRQLLNFSGHGQSEKEEVSVNSLINEVVGFVSLEKSFAECNVSTRFSAERDAVFIDKDAFRQVLINILLNAVDATAQKGGCREIHINTYNEESSASGSILGISICDNGLGISEDNLKLIFDPFFTTKEVGKGTGLGLFVCHTILERMGGTISITNRESQGIEVKIELSLPHKVSCELH